LHICTYGASGSPANHAGAGGGGGGGYWVNQITGGGGGGRGVPCGATSGANGGSGLPASPTSFNCVSVTPKSSYPLTVNGQIKISWNPQ
jgi:hypothetical protein